MNSAVDAWVITPRERVKYRDQFNALGPINGIVTGNQAKGFLMQSQLPSLMLGQIWALADTDSDGKMNIGEFSIACKLINLKLRGFDLPKTLPPQLIASLTAVGGTPTLTPTGSGSVSPLDPLKSIVGPPMVATSNIPQTMAPPMGGVPMMAPLMSAAVAPQPVAAALPILSGPPMIPPQPQPQLIQHVMPAAAPLIDTTVNLIGIQSNDLMGALTAISPPSGTPSRTMSISEKAPSIESPAGQVEWAIKGPAKLKYTQLFNTTDRSRSGFLTGTQARQLMVQTKLPQAKLAQIWALADMDLDGRLGCEEFVLAMYLCDMALLGETIPTTLPPDMVPPSFRKPVSRHGSIVGTSRHSSVSSQGAPMHMIDPDPSAGLPQTSFEDKRKENFEKGQAELERRRKALADIQRKEQEERDRKEREEADKREKIRLEAEARKQQEMERQLQRQREIEMEKEEQRQRALEQKEAARKESERQRQLEWENQRIQEMQAQRQREQDKVLKLKSQNQTLNIELSTLNEKVKDLSQKICDTRSGVTSVKSVIDGMRATRDTQMSDMSQLKARIKEQNAKLVQLSQEKAKLDAKNKMSSSGGGGVGESGQEQFNAAFSNKQIIIKQLKDKLENIRQEIESKSSDITGNSEHLNDIKLELTGLINSCEDLYGMYDVKRNQVVEMKNNRKNDSFSYSSGWDTAASAWPTESPVSSSAATMATSADKTPATQTSSAQYTRYRAIYEFAARNNDEISFQPGDIVMVPAEQNAEPGWLAGLINGHTGWFPETYVELAESPPASATIRSRGESFDTDYTKRPLEEIAEVSETISSYTVASSVSAIAPIDEKMSPSNEFADAPGEYYVACFPYQSAEADDLTFNAGDAIMVTKKEGDWWTGTIGTRVGLFPSNYVQKYEAGTESQMATPMGGGVIDNNTPAATVNAIVESPISELSTKKDDMMNGGSGGDTQNDISPSFGMINDYTSDQTATVTATENITQPYQQQSNNNMLAEEAKRQAEADSEVSQINTQPSDTKQPERDIYTPLSTSTTPSLRAKKSEIAQVLAPYEATSNEQLSLTRGQLIMIRKKSDSGWWEGELQTKGRRRQIGWFPASYVKILQGGRNSGRNTPVSASKIEMSETILDKVIALYPYKPQNDDELSFDKDDIISVLGRDEPEWWRGELNGSTGLFPSNYVGPFVSSGNV